MQRINICSICSKICRFVGDKVKSRYMKFLIGKKLDMTQVWKGDDVIAATKVQAGPCVVTQVKTEKKDGYNAIQIGYGEKKEKNITKPQRGHLKKAGVNSRYLREFNLTQMVTNNDTNGHELNLKIGDQIDVNTFEEGDKVKITGISKGKGFQGVVKKYGFHGQDASHGTKDQLRMPGSIGATGPAHVFKGTRMPGRMGGEKVTTSNLEVIEVDKENNILLIKGAVPGARNSLVMISGEGELKVVAQQETKNKRQGTEEKQENKVEDNKTKKQMATDETQIATEDKAGKKQEKVREDK